ncbi:hypothetical protein SAMN05421780_11346 [Flexibacter flexilis DSM 6793]|uniref:Uncharacterized protein n=1 Tax=Flexibacter flexilis DSM 6793 TaxID=927664 RepID=A0A1I1N8R5_9BACT|nr:hypothetical protein [Flexibacter flexilis]SFC94029.1 hypothetical protein SAMN05421780_11346 [Flexibacter flexilis DSM 6793]
MAQYTIYQAIKDFTQDFYRKALQPLVAPLIATNTGIETEPLTLRMSQEVSLWATGKFFDTDFTLKIQLDGKVVFEPYQRSKNGRERSPKTYDIGLPSLDKVLQNAAKAKDTFALLAKQWPEENNPEMVAKRKRGFAYQVQESFLPELQYCPNQAQQQQLLKDILKVMVMEKMPHAEPAPDHEL